MEERSSPEIPRIKEGFTSQRLIRRSSSWRKRALTNPVSRILCITDIGHFPETRFHWVDRSVALGEHILIYNRSGWGRAFLVDRYWSVPPEHILLIPRGVAHSYGADESAPWSIYWFHFAGSHADQICEFLRVSAEKPLVCVSHMEGLLPLFESILEIASQHPDPRDASLLSEQLLRIINIIERGVRNNERPDSHVDCRIEAAMNFMRANLNRSCSLDEMARTVGLSVPQFSNLFRSRAGTSPLRFFTRWRMQRAARWLAESQEPIAVISERIGYDDSFYFCRVFRQYVGLSPRQYRQHLHNSSVGLSHNPLTNKPN